jgi:hypothetical protein
MAKKTLDDWKDEFARMIAEATAVLSKEERLDLYTSVIVDIEALQGDQETPTDDEDDEDVLAVRAVIQAMPTLTNEQLEQAIDALTEDQRDAFWQDLEDAGVLEPEPEED